MHTCPGESAKSTSAWLVREKWQRHQSPVDVQNENDGHVDAGTGTNPGIALDVFLDQILIA